jgi:signal transduction histidine kinase
MIRLYFFLVLLSAVITVTAGAVAAWKNRHNVDGPAMGLALLVVGIWLGGYAQYFRPMHEHAALRWAQLTLSAAILIQPTLFLGLSAVAGSLRPVRWWIVATFTCAAFFLVLLWTGRIITALDQPLYMDHYVRYDRRWYPLLGIHLLAWQVGAAVRLLCVARRTSGYRRTQLAYYFSAWLIFFLTAHITIILVEYRLRIQPIGLLILPLNLGILAYVMSKARLADYNVVIARVLLYAVTMVMVAGVTLVFLGGIAVVAPGFMNQPQLMFAFVLSMTIGVGLTIILPKLLPRAERMMQERLFGRRYGYQDTLSGLVRELSTLPTIDQMLSTVATTVHSQMQISRALILMQDSLSGDYELRAESGLGPQDDAETLTLKQDAAIVKWLEGNRDALVREEMARREPIGVRQHLDAELNQRKVVLCVPMILDGRLVGLIGLGEKLNREMFFISDLRVLLTLATEVALAAKYRRIEDEVFRKNRLVELGTIAAGVAHEIRNPLASIKTFAQLMPERMDDPEFKNEFSKLVLKDVDRITKVIESMLAFARPAQVSIKEQPSNDLVEEAVLLVQSRLKAKRIELTRAFHGNPVIKVDKHQILQVLVNLLSNAADALPEQGKLRIATGISQRDIGGSGGNGNQSFAVIEVSDNGPGIPASVRNRLFDPFFTTKKEGTGLGLSISQKIVRDHGGSITVSSIEGKGATFQVSLPLL